MFSMKDQKASLVVMFFLQDQKDKKEGKNYNLPPLGNAWETILPISFLCTILSLIKNINVGVLILKPQKVPLISKILGNKVNHNNHNILI